MTREEANRILAAITKMQQNATDEQALDAADLFPSYETLTANGRTVSRGFRFRYNGKLYKTEQTTYTFDGTFAPSAGTESLYSEVARTTSGTAETPIPYSGNMELEEGKYYVENDMIYRCTRSSGIPVYNSLHDLIGIYVVPEV